MIVCTVVLKLFLCLSPFHRSLSQYNSIQSRQDCFCAVLYQCAQMRRGDADKLKELKAAANSAMSDARNNF